MSTLELTDRFCLSAKAVDGKQTDYFDTVVNGLCLRVTPAGTRTWNLIYTRPGDGKRARMKIGRYPEIPLGGKEGARQRAKDERAKIGDGADPIIQRKAEAASQTVFDLVENYIARHASAKRSGNEIARRLRKNITGHDAEGNKIKGRSTGCISDVKLSALHRRDITKCIDAVKDRGAHVEANRLFEDVRSMIRWARTVIVTRESLAAELDYAIAMAHQREQATAAISAIVAKAKLFGLIGSKRADTNNDLNRYSLMSSGELIYQITSTANEIRSAQRQPLGGVPQAQGGWRR